MISSPITQLDNIEISSFNYALKKKTRKKQIGILAEELDFEFIPQSKKQDKAKKRLVFIFKTNERSKFVHCEITVTVDYSFLEEKSEEEEVKYISNGLIPQMISFIRGYLYSVTNNAPVRIIVPFVNVIESLKRKIEEADENNCDRATLI